MKIQITNGMFMAIIINMIYAKAIGLTQGSMAREVGGDIWISTFIAIVIGASVMLVTVLAVKRLPAEDLFQQAEKLVGKWLTKVISLLSFLFFLGAYNAVMITFVYHLKDYFLPEAPTIIFVVASFIVGTYAVYYGLEVIARMAFIGAFSVIALNIVLMLGSFSEFDIRELLPVMESGMVRTAWASRHHIADWMMPTMMAAFILPLVKDKQTWVRSSAAGVFFGGLFVIMWPILETGVLSGQVTAQYIVSCMQMARSAQLGIFIHRYEMIMVAFFALSILTQIMMTLLCASVSVQKIFGMKDYRKVLIPISLLLNGVSYWVVDDHTRAMWLLEHQWIAISLGIGVCVPLLLWLLGFAFKGKINEARKQDQSQ